MTSNDVEIPIVEPDNDIREGVLFVADDKITAPLPPSRTAQDKHSYEEFAVFQAVVEVVREGKDGKGPVRLAPGSVKHPNHVRCVRTGDYKLARYFDPSGKVPQEWGMYDLRNDPIEAVNLVEVGVTPLRVRTLLPHATKMQVVADHLAALLAKLERRTSSTFHPD